MKDLMALVTPVLDHVLEQPAVYALALAGKLGAHVTTMVGTIEPFQAIRSGDVDNMQGLGAPRQPPSLQDRLARTTELIQSAAGRAGVACEILTGSDGPLLSAQIVTAAAQVRDLTAIAVHGPLTYPRQGLVEAALFGSGRPVLMIPPSAQPFSGGVIVVGWDATRSAVRALHVALPLLTRAGDVVVATVSDDKQPPVLASGPAVCRYLEHWAVDGRFHSVPRRQKSVGDDLLLFAGDLGADLIVLGGFAHAREREFLFGSVTRDIFQAQLKIPVLLSH